MRFDITIDKKAEAVIDRRLCVNCGECLQNCPTAAIYENQKAAVCMCPPGECCSAEHIEAADSFGAAKVQAVETACSVGCPLGIIPQTVAALVEKGEYELAAEHIRSRNPMPLTSAAVCEHFCQETCKLGVFCEEPLNMRALEKFVLSKYGAEPFKYVRKYHRKVAVIGAGPAGLSAAHHLAMAGFPVTIFEKDEAAGGAVRWGIPDFRANKKTFDEEIDRILSAGVEIKYGWHIGKEHSLDELRDNGFEAVLIAVGESHGIKPEVEEYDAEGVYECVEVMRQVIGGYDEGIVIGDDVVIVGSSGTAADLARAIKRMGRDVICITEETAGELQMSNELEELMINEGIEFKYETSAGQIIVEGGKVKAVELVQGNARNHFCDTVIFVNGQKCVTQNICNAQTYPDGKIRIDERYRTNKDMIFACGDATGETASVVEAIAAGRDAAVEMVKILSGTVPVGRGKTVSGAPDSEAIYPENIRRGIPQYEEMITEPIPDEEAIFWAEEDEPEKAGGIAFEIKEDETAAEAEDITAVLRAAGIEEEAQAFGFADDAKRVAIIGGGIAGITAALALARKGIRPTIFEKEPALGGSYRWLATDKRIDKKALAEELDKIKDYGIDVVYNVTAGVKPNLDMLMKEGYDAVLFAVGDYGGQRHKISIGSCAGLFDMAFVMGNLVADEKVRGLGGRVLIAGGDEMTFDAARKLKNFCEEVTVIAPWSKGSMQARTGAVDAAVAEGVNLVAGACVTGVECKDGKVYNVACKITNRNFNIDVPCDALIMSGGGPDTEAVAFRNLKLNVDEDGYFVTNHRLATSIKGVFAIGKLDMSAADAGRTGAAAIENYLTGVDGYISLGDKDKTEIPTDHDMLEGVRAGREKGFEAGRKLFADETAKVEAGRCIGCGYHNLKPELCMGCGACVRVCPVGAVKLVPVAGGVEQSREV